MLIKSYSQYDEKEFSKVSIVTRDPAVKSCPADNFTLLEDLPMQDVSHNLAGVHVFRC